MDRFNNYHKHDHISNIFSPDVNVKIEEYAKRAIELSEKNVWTTNHGSGGDIFEARDICDKYGLNCKFGIEGYIVPDATIKDKSNYHIIIIPKTNIARKKINKASSHANRDGFYYKPRFFIEDILCNFDRNELFITTACVGGLLKTQESVEKILYPLYEKFGESVMLEIQSHDVDIQRASNMLALKIHKEKGMPIIAANDSHYIYPWQSLERTELLKGKNINYGEEDLFVLDYPDVDTMFERFKKQGVLPIDVCSKSIEQTLCLDICENIDIDKEIKMPTIYEGKTEEEKIKILKKEVNKKFKKVMDEDRATKEEALKYIKECKREMSVIEETSEIHTSDYFLLNTKLFDIAINKYGGILTRTGRGSCGAFILNKILGLTQIDRLRTTLPLYSERFMSTARLLENHALPDFDANVVSQEPFIRASKELLGEKGCFPMIAYGTMKESEAFRNVCRSENLDYDVFNDIGKNLDKYKEDKKWNKYIEESSKYVGTIISSSIHPCAFILFSGDIESEIGVVRCGEYLCAMITSNEADSWKYLKNDYLVVSVWEIISKTFDLIGRPIMTVKELLENIDERVWKLFDDGITCTLNQVGEDWATALLKKYKPRTMEELAMFVAAIRPSFESQRNDFVNRVPYTTGSKELDVVLESTSHRVLFQENLMQYFEWLGVSPADSIGLIKKISKKKIKPSDFEELTGTLKENWIKKVGNDDKFYEMWKQMQDMMGYGFNSPHGEATALDNLYCAYLKVNYPIEYYTVVLNIYQNDEEKTIKLTKELSYFGLNLISAKFRHSVDTYSFDKSSMSIFKGLSSVKYISSGCAKELYDIRMVDFKSFVDLLVYIFENTSVNSRQMRVLISINFFEEFGKVGKLLNIYTEFLSKYKKTYVEKTKEKRIEELLRFESNEKNIDLPISEQINLEKEYIGYISFTANIPKRYVYVSDVDIKYTPRAKLYCIATGKTIDVKIEKKFFNKKENKFSEGNILFCKMFSKKEDWRKTESGFEKTGTYSDYLKEYSVVSVENFDKIIGK